MGLLQMTEQYKIEIFQKNNSRSWHKILKRIGPRRIALLYINVLTRGHCDITQSDHSQGQCESGGGGGLEASQRELLVCRARQKQSIEERSCCRRGGRAQLVTRPLSAPRTPGSAEEAFVRKVGALSVRLFLNN